MSMSMTAQEQSNIHIFRYPSCLQNGIASDSNVHATLRNIAEEVLYVSSMAKGNKEKIKNSKYVWAIEYGGDIYLNSKYTSGLRKKNNVYLKINDWCIEYGIVYIELESGKDYVKSKNMVVPGMLPSLVMEADRKNEFWKGKDGGQFVILVSQLDLAKKKSMSWHSEFFAQILDRNEFRDIFAQELSKEFIRHMSFKQAMNLIQRNCGRNDH